MLMYNRFEHPQFLQLLIHFLHITERFLSFPLFFSADEKFDGTYQTNVVVSNEGGCLHVPPGIFKSTCQIDITWFPFDEQLCDLKFGSWTYSGWKVSLLFGDIAVCHHRECCGLVHLLYIICYVVQVSCVQITLFSYCN